MKILVISNMYPSEKSVSFGIFVKNQVEALRKKGHSVDVLAVRNQSSSKVQVILKYMKWLLASVLSLILSGRTYHVIHVHYVFPSGLIGLMFKKFNPNAKLIVTAHGGDINKMAKKNETTRKWTAKILKQADHVVAVGQDLHREINEKYDIPLEKLSLVSMGVNRNVFQAYGKTTSRQQLQIKSSELPIVFVGNIIKEKGIVELIEAFIKVKQHHSTTRLDIIGKINSANFYDELQAIIKHNKITDVYFHDAIEQTEVAKWMSAAEVFVLPSYMEGFGLVAVEAMSCHTPVVATNVGGLSYLAKDNCALLVEPENADQLFLGISNILSNRELYKELVINAENRAQENDEDYILDKLIALYTQ